MANKPSALAIRLLALPSGLYRAHLGRFLGTRFLLLTHRGRKSGRLFQTPLEVVNYNRTMREATVISAWGESADWYRNLNAGGAVQVAIGGRQYKPSVRFLDQTEREALLREFRRLHPLEARLAPYILGWKLMGTDSNLAELAARLRAVVIGPDRPS
ncbi:MAG TPA: nitroreductase family deazaflavin-dependent oxidoreductase [Candidatus Micrarchaeaceae archaeon]|nr:nitroreductase family deazaflavin-dependent oxidoreductase [Candidatus Micrarchaeaceae archaeon]